VNWVKLASQFGVKGVYLGIQVRVNQSSDLFHDVVFVHEVEDASPTLFHSVYCNATLSLIEQSFPFSGGGVFLVNMNWNGLHQSQSI